MTQQQQQQRQQRQQRQQPLVVGLVRSVYSGIIASTKFSYKVLYDYISITLYALCQLLSEAFIISFFAELMCHQSQNVKSIMRLR